MGIFQKKQVSPIQIGLALGIFCALAMLFISLMHLAFGRYDLTIQLIQEWYVGYSLTPMGIVVGLLYGFFDGFVGGVVFMYILRFFTKK